MEASSWAAWVGVLIAAVATIVALSQARYAQNQTALLREQIARDAAEKKIAQTPRFALAWEPGADLDPASRRAVPTDRWPHSVFVVTQESGPPVTKAVLRIADRSLGDFLRIADGAEMPQISIDNVLWNLRAGRSERLFVRLWKTRGTMVIEYECETGGEAFKDVVSAPFDLEFG
ncbi:hypothetical protein [Catellatospora sp. NPDC049133]|uniref:hypothetical protein n=1 Tax=Catellatospora sp. NPDC049133 TaxID=3155499 RepID=UPI0033FBD960